VLMRERWFKKEGEREREKVSEENVVEEEKNKEKIRQREKQEKKKGNEKREEFRAPLVKNLLYPHASLRKDKERQFARFKDIVNNCILTFLLKKL